MAPFQSKHLDACVEPTKSTEIIIQHRKTKMADQLEKYLTITLLEERQPDEPSSYYSYSINPMLWTIFNRQNNQTTEKTISLYDFNLEHTSSLVCIHITPLAPLRKLMSRSRKAPNFPFYGFREFTVSVIIRPKLILVKKPLFGERCAWVAGRKNWHLLSER
jgi:hypothetical protein